VIGPRVPVAIRRPSSSRTGVTSIAGLQILQIRTALSDAYVAHGLAAPTFTDPGLPPGTVIKAVRLGAEKRLSRLLGRKAKLELFVRVTPRWKDAPRMLAELGYERLVGEKS